MVIDSHAHLKHGDSGHTEYLRNRSSRRWTRRGLIGRWCSGSARRRNARSRWRVAAAVMFPKRLIPYAYGLPSYSGDVLRLVERAVREFGFKGIKIHAGECTLADYVSDPIFALAGDLGVPCLVDCCAEFLGDGAAGGQVP